MCEDKEVCERTEAHATVSFALLINVSESGNEEWWTWVDDGHPQEFFMEVKIYFRGVNIWNSWLWTNEDNENRNRTANSVNI